MNSDKAIALLLIALVTVSCSGPESGTGGRATGAAHSASSAAETPPVSITHYTEATELFVEFRPLVKGEPAAFAAHLTRLADFKPVRAGRVTVALTGGGQPDERAQAEVGATPGIFRPVLTPNHAGKRRLVFRLADGNLTATHDLGEVEVHPDRNAVQAAAQSDQGRTVAFTKEQQWAIDFAQAPVSQRTLRESIAVTATLRPRASGEAALAAPGTGLLRPGPGGFPQVGMQVGAGQTLAFLLPRLGGETDTATLRLAVDRARIELEHAARERERLENLLAVEAIPAKRVTEARSRERLIQAELKAAEQRAASYDSGAGGIAVKSPIRGTVVAVHAIPGAAVSEGKTIVHVAALEKLWLEARVPESDVGRVGTPTGAFFQLEGASRATVLEAGRNARLIAFGGMVDPTTRTVPAILEFDNPGGVLRAGMNVQARLYTGRVLHAVAVPATALVDDAGQAVVFVQKGGESFERRAVATGLRDGDWVAAASGLVPGERVVTRGAYQVRVAAVQPATVGHGHAH